VEDKGSSYKGKKPANTRHFYSHPHSTQAQRHFPDEVNWNDPENIIVEYALDDCPWNAEELEKFYEFAAHKSKDPMPQAPVQQEHNQFHHQVPPHIPDTIVMPNVNHFQPHMHYQHPPKNIFVPPANQFHNHMQFQHKAVAKGPKLSFPEFDGLDPDGWIRKAEKYFELVRVPNEGRVQIVVMYIKGKAEFWWRGTGCTDAQLPWHQFCGMISERFNEISIYDAIGQFHNLKQQSSVKEYVEKFEELMGLVKRNNPSLTETYFVSSFTSGLKDYI